MIAPDTPPPAEPSPEGMRYGLLGSDDSSPQEKLEKFTGEVGWDFLRPHCQAGVLYFVDSTIPLIQAGAAFTNNDTATVEAWLKCGDLVKIENLHAAQWENTEALFETLVVSPFVLCRPVPSL